MKQKIKLILSYVVYIIINKVTSLYTYYQKSLFADSGNDIIIGKHSDFIYSHIHIGNHVYVGAHASFIASIAHIYIKDYVMFGPHVTIRGGDHRMNIVGKPMIKVRENEKLSENDTDVIIEEECWIGCNVTILKGVTIGRGAVVGAGSLVVKSIPPYAVAVGVPAKVVKFRFSINEILEHEEKLYPKELRLSKKQLLAFGIQ